MVVWMVDVPRMEHGSDGPHPGEMCDDLQLLLHLRILFRTERHVIFRENSPLVIHQAVNLRFHARIWEDVPVIQVGTYGIYSRIFQVFRIYAVRVLFQSPDVFRPVWVYHRQKKRTADLRGS